MTSYAYISEWLVEKLDVKHELIKPEATLSDLGIDSLSVVELVFDLEDEYGIEVPEEKVDFNTLGEAAAMVDELIEAKGG